ncbi:MAG: TIGR03619 family F420-dependent LLM class oxidoreductase, partial [Actinobacteria bacterium]|nr:TIGR03619 family F420-dependent LLM class oxidoreductase [Actinomycetota bacterium]
MSKVRWVLVLSENWTIVDPNDMKALVRIAQEAEDAGIDAVMLSEHIVLGRSAGSNGVMANPREYAYPGNQPPDMSWPNSIVLLSAIAAVTKKLRLVGGAIIAPLRHPLLLAKEIATLDRLSEGRFVMLPTVSWHEDEYAALGIPFNRRGAILDEQLEVLAKCWQPGPVSHHGAFFNFDEAWLEPRPQRDDGPRLWFGGQEMHAPLLRRLVKYGHGFNPLGVPSDTDMKALTSGLKAAGRSLSDIELVGGINGNFETPNSLLDLDRVLEPLP